MSSPPAPPQFSEDGSWWWTGVEWVPAEQAPRPPSARKEASATASTVDERSARRLLTNCRDGQVLVEGRDVILLQKGKEDRLPLGGLQINKESRDWRNRPYWSISDRSGKYRIKQPDDEERLQWLVKYQSDNELQFAVLDIIDGRKVERIFAPEGVWVPVTVEKGYLRLGIDQVSIPVHMIDFAGTERGFGTVGSWSSYVTLFGAGTKVGQAGSSSWDAANQTADWINRVVRALREHQQQVVHQAHEQHVALVRCLYCGTRVQDVGRCIQCGAPLPQP